MLTKGILRIHDLTYDDSSDEDYEYLCNIAKVYNWWKRIPKKYHYKNPYEDLEKINNKRKKCNLM